MKVLFLISLVLFVLCVASLMYHVSVTQDAMGIFKSLFSLYALTVVLSFAMMWKMESIEQHIHKVHEL
jgi:hypothetical protein